MEWEQLKECTEAMGVAESTAQEAWNSAGGSDGGTVQWDHILSHMAALSSHVRSNTISALLYY